MALGMFGPLACMGASEANKTQCAPMAIENTCWDEALVDGLAQIKGANRTLRPLMAMKVAMWVGACCRGAWAI